MLARKIPSVCLFFRTARRSVEPANHAGASALLERETTLQRLSPSALLVTVASIKQHPSSPLRLPSPTLSNALNRSVPTNGQLARMTPSASPLFKIIRTSVQTMLLVGSSVFQRKEIQLRLTWPSVVRRTTALDKRLRHQLFPLRS